MKHHFINIINNTLNDSKICEHLINLEQVKDFSYMVLSNTDKPSKDKYDSFVDINDSINCVRDFFYRIDEKLGRMYENILQEKNSYNGIDTTSVKFFHLPKSFSDYNKSGLRNDGSVIIDYSEIIYDMYVIAHEITHKFSYQKEHNSKLNTLLAEVPSITMELFLEDYLLNNTSYNKNEILINRDNELIELYNNSLKFMYEYIILDINDRKGYISRDLIEDYIKENYSEISDKLLSEEKETLNYLKQDSKLGFYKRQKYILGMLLAINMKEEFDDNYKDLTKLINILGNTDISIKRDIDRINVIDLISIKNQLYINNSYEYMNRLENNYKSFNEKTKMLKR